MAVGGDQQDAGRRMLRRDRLLLRAAAALAAWALLLQAPLPARARALVLWSPALAVAGFGAYLVAWLVYGVATFRTVPEEAEALHRDIARARAGLRERGYEY